jgi:hypothetical protein
MQMTCYYQGSVENICRDELDELALLSLQSVWWNGQQCVGALENGR